MPCANRHERHARLFHLRGNPFHPIGIPIGQEGVVQCPAGHPFVYKLGKAFGIRRSPHVDHFIHHAVGFINRFCRFDQEGDLLGLWQGIEHPKLKLRSFKSNNGLFTDLRRRLQLCFNTAIGVKAGFLDCHQGQSDSRRPWLKRV